MGYKMWIKKIKLNNFRNYQEQEINFEKNINIFYGENAQGKTNIIEAIFLCSLGKSFRAKKDSEMIKLNEKNSLIEIEYEKSDRDGKIKIELCDKKNIFINGIKIKKLSELLGNINTVIFTPDDINILKGGPQNRRRFLDIMISQLRPNYMHILNSYLKIIEQRNKYLRQIKEERKDENLLDIWDEKLAEYAIKICEYRQEFIEKIKSLNPDVICVVAYGKILPKEILEIPKYGCINVHGSLLPKYRGAAPIQWAVLNGDKETGVTTMYMDVGMDTGDMILKEKVEIGEDETTGELWDRLSKIGGKLLVETLKQVEDGTPPREKQGEEFTMAPMLNKEMSKINWDEQTAQNIKNLVRGLNPIMGAYTFLDKKKIKFWKVDIAKQDEIIADNIEILKNGTVILSNPKDGLFIKTKDGILKVLEIQGENAKRMSIGDFLRGNSIEEFEVFE